MARRISNPPGSWDMQIEIPYPMGLEDGGQIFTRGQCDNDAAGQPRHQGDIQAQIEAVTGFYRTIWDDLAVPRSSLTRLVAFYDRAAGLSPGALRAALWRSLGTECAPTIVPVPLAALSYPGMAIEIDYLGNLAAPREAFWLDGQGQGTGPPDAVRAGDLIYIGAQEPRNGAGTLQHPRNAAAQLALIGERTAAILDHFGLPTDALVKLVTYFDAGIGDGAWGELAASRANWFGQDKPVVTDQPLPDLGEAGLLLRLDGLAVAAGDRRDIRPPTLAPSPIAPDHPPAIRVGAQLWTGGQLAWSPAAGLQAQGDLVGQTKIAMERIASLLTEGGFDFAEVVKVNAYYRGGASTQQLHDNMAVRNAYYRWPGPGSTGVPVERHLRRDAMTQVEVTAIRS